MSGSNDSAASRFLMTLACLVIIPLAAVFGTWLPDLVRQLSQMRWGMAPAVARDLLGGPESPSAISEAPPWGGPGGPETVGSVAWPRSVGQGASTDSQASALPTNPWGSASVFEPQVSQQRIDSTGPGQRLARSGQPSGGHPAREWPGRRPSDPTSQNATVGVFPAGSSDALSTRGPNGGQPIAADSPGQAVTQPSPLGGDPFVVIQSRLQQLGAVYYLLETWGSDPPCYRFYARMAVAGNRNVTQHFEAVDRVPIRAMQRVLEQVERWKAAQKRAFGPSGS